jgi:hypothetical protein
MAIVPRVSGPSVQREGMPGARVADIPGNLGAGLEQGIGQLGKAAIAIAAREQEKADLAQVLEAKRRLGDWERSWFDPENQAGVYGSRGRDALGLTDRMDEDYQRVEAEIAGSIRSPRAQAKFRELAIGTRQAVLERAQGYAVREHDAYVKSEFEASMLSSTEAAARAAVDGRPEDQAKEIQYGLSVLRSQAVTQGEPPELTRQREQAYLSAVHATALKAMVDAGSIEEATSYLDANGAAMSVKDAGDVTARLRPLQAEILTDALVYGAQAGVSAQSLGGDLGLDDIWPSLERQESGSQGQAAVSPKGALGVAQVMPATGPEAARLAGLPWDPDRLKNDEAYNRALGRAYMGEQLRVFGSMPLALAAYNAGPGAVQRWLRTIGDPRRGEVSVAEFVERIPFKETRGYVQKIYERGGFSLAGAESSRPGAAPEGAPAAAAGGVPGGTLSQQLAFARQFRDPLVRKQLEAKVRERWSLAEHEEREQKEAALSEVNRKVWDAPVGMPLARVLSADELAFVTQHGYRDNLEKTVRDRITGSLPQTDMMLYDDLRRMSVDDPQRFAGMRGYILENRHRLAAADYELLLKRHEDVTKPDGAGARADWQTAEQRRKAVVDGLGLKSKQQVAAVGMAWDQAERALIQTLDGKKPTPEQYDALARNVRANIARRIAAGEPWVAQYAQYETDAMRLSSARREQIRQGLRAALGREPIEAEILDYEYGPRE